MNTIKSYLILFNLLNAKQDSLIKQISQIIQIVKYLLLFDKHSTYTAKGMCFDETFYVSEVYIGYFDGFAYIGKDGIIKVIVLSTREHFVDELIIGGTIDHYNKDDDTTVGELQRIVNSFKHLELTTEHADSQVSVLMFKNGPVLDSYYDGYGFYDQLKKIKRFTFLSLCGSEVIRNEIPKAYETVFAGMFRSIYYQHHIMTK